MKLLRVFFLFILVLTLGATFNSCCEGYYYEWIFIQIKNRDNNEMPQTNSISKDNYGIQINLIDRKYISINFNPFISQSYAYSCEQQYTNIDEIDSISIISLNEFNNSYSENSDISSEFTASSEQIFVQEEEEGVTINDFVELIKLSNDSYRGQHIKNIDLHLNTDTIFNTSHQFVVTIHLSNSKILIDTTSIINLY